MTQLSTIADSYFTRYRYPDWLRTHSLLVGRLAARLARARAERDGRCDPRVVELGGYLHDIGKSPLLSGDERGHHVLGPLVLQAEGLGELAELSRRHPVYAPLDPSTAPRTVDEKIVYYADRRAGLSVMGLEERMAEQDVRHPGFEPLRAAELAAARQVEIELFAGLGFGPGDLA